MGRPPATTRQAVTVAEQGLSQSKPRLLACVVGLFCVVVAAWLGAMPGGTWQAMTRWAGAPWYSEPFRWAVVALIATIGISFVRARPIFVVIHAALFALTALAIDYLLAEWCSRWLESALGPGGAFGALAVASAAFGYLIYTHPKAGAPSLKGMLGLLMVVAAVELVVGTQAQHQWFKWPEYAAALGPGAVRIMTEWSKWGQEVLWAVVLVMTAIGVSLSRTRPVHLLNALLLAGLAYCCVKGGYGALKVFPELSASGKLIQIEHESYTNVDGWRWAVCAELVCLSVVLVHMSLGMGALNLAYALAWMAAGLMLYHSVGTMSLVRTGSEALGGADPLSDMGMPVAERTSGTIISPRRVQEHTGSSAAPRGGLVGEDGFSLTLEQQRHVIVNELTPFAWMILTAMCAGLIAVSGLRMLLENIEYRNRLVILLWLGVLFGGYQLWQIWPKDPGQSWEEWLAAFKFSRYHVFLFWLIFFGSMAIAGIWALGRSSQVSTWGHVAIAAVFLGTAASLVGAAVMIAFGGFPRLPVWVYCVIAAGQSSLAWALLFHVNPPMNRPVTMRRLTGG